MNDADVANDCDTSDGGVGDTWDGDDDDWDGWDDANDYDVDDEAHFWEKPLAEQPINYTGSSQSQKRLYLYKNTNSPARVGTVGRRAISFTNFHRILNRLVLPHNLTTPLKIITITTMIAEQYKSSPSHPNHH